MLEQVVKFFIVFFVVVEPVSLLPLFVSLTEGANEAYRRRMARKAIILSGAILFVFALFGAKFLEAMGISLEAFRIFGGLLPFLIALEMVFARESGTRTSSREAAESRQRADISVFPLAFPFIAGPGALATILLWFGPVPASRDPLHWAALFTGVLAVLAIAWVSCAPRAADESIGRRQCLGSPARRHPRHAAVQFVIDGERRIPAPGQRSAAAGRVQRRGRAVRRGARSASWRASSRGA